ncbi:Mammalian cell entry related domain protein [Segniliparus rotundus DSM 44985]|uniref:Mammalian cell entry related domain protein n=1 Tax=Segniliparus rotundus (strain ATCC BAA-972 / CDC 1076 / CIP 108378 / DSM 44985 / JCM 13578) TaxID=640132 RepID=D6Z970_SEGRD|nr:MlaD family protein [Segniliparus rotundus]ADG98500.1 Mammalian cell entry related domain protein [Segniliparus rotundus DSM 44985]
MKFDSKVSLVLLVVLSLVGMVYLGVGVMGVRPTQKFVHFQVMIPTSGGLLDNSPVLINGRNAGRVRAITVVPGGLKVEGEYDAKYPVSKKSVLVIANLSVAGEQYLNFMQPPNNEAPFFQDGAVIDDPRQIHVSATVGDALSKASYISGQLDPEVLDDVANTADEIFKGLDPEFEELRELINQAVRLNYEHGDEIGRVFDNLQTNLDLIKPLVVQLPAVAEEFQAVVGPAKAELEAFKVFGQKMTPAKWQAAERLVGVLDRHLGNIIVDGHPLLMALRPISAYFRTTYFDPASTMNALLKMLPQDGVPRVVLNMAG